MNMLSAFLEFLGFGSDDAKKPTHTDSVNADIVPQNAAERELLERVRSLGLNHKHEIQYSNLKAGEDGGQFLAVLPWPSDDDLIDHGEFIQVLEPKEHGAVMRTANEIRNATIEVASKYGCTPTFTTPFLFRGGMLVMFFGFK